MVEPKFSRVYYVDFSVFSMNLEGDRSSKEIRTEVLADSFEEALELGKEYARLHVKTHNHLFYEIKSVIEGPTVYLGTYEETEEIEIPKLSGAGVETSHYTETKDGGVLQYYPGGCIILEEESFLS